MAGRGDDPRVQQGLRLLVDRAFDDGGINYGNRTVLGKRTDPIPGPTAIMLLALQGLPDHPRIAAAVSYLLGHAAQSNDVEHLCWAAIALGPLPRSRCFQSGLGKAREPDSRGHGRTQSDKLRARSTHALGSGSAGALAGERNKLFGAAGTCRSRCVVNASAPWKPYAFLCPSRTSLSGNAWAPSSEAWPSRLPDVYDRSKRLLLFMLRRLAITTRTWRMCFVVNMTLFASKVPLAGKRVILKPNLVEYHRDKVINTHPHVIAAAIELCQHEGRERNRHRGRAGPLAKRRVSDPGERPGRRAATLQSLVRRSESR